MKDGEKIKDIKSRLDDLRRECTAHKIAFTDLKIQEVFVKALGCKEWDDLAREEREEYPLDDDSKGRTYLQTYLRFKKREEYNAVRAEERPAKFNKDKVYSIQNGQLTNSNLGAQEEKELLNALLQKYPSGGGNPPGGGSQQQASRISWKNRVQKANKTIPNPFNYVKKCGHCRKDRHKSPDCPIKNLPQNALGAKVKKEWDEYKMKCDTANEVYNLTIKVTPPQHSILSNEEKQKLKRKRQEIFGHKPRPKPPDETEELNQLQQAVDSGASAGCEHDPQELQDITALEGCEAILPDGKLIPIPGEGGKEYSQEAEPIKGVKLIPQVHRPLQSVSQCAQQWQTNSWKANAHFDGKDMIWYKRREPMYINPDDIIMTASEDNGIYLHDDDIRRMFNTTSMTTHNEHDVDKALLYCVQLAENPEYRRVGLYNFKTGNGIIEEHLANSELGEKPLPRPKISK
jgi:hypothetical protein